jgi:hypothetical protein
MGSESHEHCSSSPITHESSYAGHCWRDPLAAIDRPDGARPPQETADPIIPTSEAAYTAEAFRNGLRKPDFTGGPQEEGKALRAMLSRQRSSC